MENNRNFRLVLIAAIGGLALTACAASQDQYVDDWQYGQGQYAESQYGYDQYGYDQYGQGQYGQSQFGQYGDGFSQYGGEYAQHTASFAPSRYGNSGGGAELRPPCGVQVAPCGFMSVVPVYPIYQVEAPPPPPEPIVEIFDEPPTVEYYEPSPTVFLDPEPIPEPVYEPVHSWPEPENPVQSWTPIRK